MHPIIQAEMFKTHIRPILFYALENFHLSLSDMKQIKRIEGNALKRLLGLSTTCKSTDLFLSFEMFNTYDRIKWLKLNHYLRMTKNNFTNGLLNELETKYVKNSFIEEIKDLTASVILPSEYTLYDKCIIAIEDLNEKYETLIAESKKVEQLKIIYNLDNKNVMKSIINDLLESQRHDKNDIDYN
jgi:hypothetical protein